MKRVVLVVFVATLACNPARDRRNKECGEWADWSNHVGDPVAAAVPESEKLAAKTGEAQAAVCRKLATAARKAAQTAIPFQDPWVKDLATRFVKTWDGVAIALDHQADAWSKGDKAAFEKAAREEMDAMAPRKALTDDWMNKCRL